MDKKNKEILLQFIDEIWNRGNFAHLDRFLNLKYTIHSDPGDPWEFQTIDLATFKERVNSSRAVFPDLHFTVNEAVAEGDKVAISWQFQGTHKGSMPSILATGKPVKVLGLTIYYFANGKITGHLQVVDRLGFFEQLGKTESTIDRFHTLPFP